MTPLLFLKKKRDKWDNQIEYNFDKGSKREREGARERKRCVCCCRCWGMDGATVRLVSTWLSSVILPSSSIPNPTCHTTLRLSSHRASPSPLSLSWTPIPSVSPRATVFSQPWRFSLSLSLSLSQIVAIFVWFCVGFLIIYRCFVKIVLFYTYVGVFY